MSDVRYKILIVEDEEALSQVLKERFDNEGFDVMVARDGETALKLALSKQPDIVLLDIIMPKLGGLSMLKRLREDEAGKNVRVVVLTNVNDTKEVHEALTLGARDFLVKSDWSISDLVENIRNQLKQPFAL